MSQTSAANRSETMGTGASILSSLGPHAHRMDGVEVTQVTPVQVPASTVLMPPQIAPQYAYPNLHYHPYYSQGYYPAPNTPGYDTPTSGGKILPSRMHGGRYRNQPLLDHQLQKLHEDPRQLVVPPQLAGGQLPEGVQLQTLQPLQAVPQVHDLQPVPYDNTLFQAVPPTMERGGAGTGASGPYTYHMSGDGGPTPVLIRPSSVEPGHYISPGPPPLHAMPGSASGPEVPHIQQGPVYGGYMPSRDITPSKLDFSDSDCSMECSPPNVKSPRAAGDVGELDDHLLSAGSQRPLTLDDAVSLYINHLIHENDRIVKIPDLLTPARPVNWANERYAREVLRAAAKFPTKKFRSFLAKFNIEIEVNYESAEDENVPGSTEVQGTNTPHEPTTGAQDSQGPGDVTMGTEQDNGSDPENEPSISPPVAEADCLDASIPEFPETTNMPGNVTALPRMSTVTQPLIPVPMSSASAAVPVLPTQTPVPRLPPPSCLRTASQNLGAALHDPANYMPALKPKMPSAYTKACSPEPQQIRPLSASKAPSDHQVTSKSCENEDQTASNDFTVTMNNAREMPRQDPKSITLEDSMDGEPIIVTLANPDEGDNEVESVDPQSAQQERSAPGAFPSPDSATRSLPKGLTTPINISPRIVVPSQGTAVDTEDEECSVRSMVASIQNGSDIIADAFRISVNSPSTPQLGAALLSKHL